MTKPAPRPGKFNVSLLALLFGLSLFLQGCPPSDKTDKDCSEIGGVTSGGQRSCNKPNHSSKTASTPSEKSLENSQDSGKATQSSQPTSVEQNPKAHPFQPLRPNSQLWIQEFWHQGKLFWIAFNPSDKAQKLKIYETQADNSPAPLLQLGNLLLLVELGPHEALTIEIPLNPQQLPSFLSLFLEQANQADLLLGDWHVQDTAAFISPENPVYQSSVNQLETYSSFWFEQPPSVLAHEPFSIQLIVLPQTIHHLTIYKNSQSSSLQLPYLSIQAIHAEGFKIQEDPNAFHCTAIASFKNEGVLRISATGAQVSFSQLAFLEGAFELLSLEEHSKGAKSQRSFWHSILVTPPKGGEN